MSDQTIDLPPAEHGGRMILRHTEDVVIAGKYPVKAGEDFALFVTPVYPKGENWRYEWRPQDLYRWTPQDLEMMA
jgi:hypothetical protein